MANNKFLTSHKNAGKQSLLPPRSPFLNRSPAYTDYASSSIESKGIPKLRGHRPRQRTPSESFLLEEQPSWLDDLLNEPETPISKGSHRRSSSDSFAYLEAFSNSSNVSEDPKLKDLTSGPSRGSSDIDAFGNVPEDPRSSSGGLHIKSSINSPARPSNCSLARDNIPIQNSTLSCTWGSSDKVPSTVIDEPDHNDFCPDDVKDYLEREDSVASEADQKKARQKFAQRSRVRKLQYIAELERHVQSLEAEGSSISAELDFVGQHHFVLSMENKALKQRLDSLEQEHLIKCMEHEILEREISRLRALLYQHHHQLLHPEQYQQQMLQPSHHRRSGSKDLDSHFSNLSLRNRAAGSGSKTVSGSLHI